MPVTVALDYRPALLGHGGIGRAVRELASHLQRRDDVALHLFAHSLSPPRCPVRCPPGAVLHRLPIPGRSLRFLHRLGCGADRLAGRPAVFHWTDYVHPPVSAARVVLTVHDLAFAHDASWHGADAPALLERTRRAAAAAAALVVPSAATALDVATFLPEAKPPEVIPFGADHVPAGRPPRPDLGVGYHALCLGTIEPRKNHRALLAAWRLLERPRPLLVVVGRPGWACADIERELREAEREGLVRWLPAADDALAFALLAHARLLVYPSLWEGFGFPPLEAMALGVPVVAHDCAPLRELTDGAAVLVNARDPALLASGIASVLGDGGLQQRLIAQGRKRATCFRWADCAAAYAALYARVAEARP